ncbi:MAG: hypothetical protein R3331_03530 [Sulfurospirillaceae bacterium]|nr:hypothetical protein [Sulfurospirillaceae bacterium]
MNRFNPLHVAILLIVLLGFLMFHLSGVKKGLIQADKQYKETLQLATDLKGLKSAYSNKIMIEKTMDSVLRLPLLSKSNIKKEITISSIILRSKGMNKNVLDLLMSKILNGSYNISSLQIRRINDETASLKMEIKW